MNTYPALPTLETERLVLQSMQPAHDAPFIFELVNERAFIENVADRGVRTLEEAQAYIADKLIPSYSQHGFGFYRVNLRETGEPVGICGLIRRDVLPGPDIGYSLLTRYAGRGYAYEAARVVMDHARHALRLPRLAAITAPSNFRSIRLLEKLGMQFEKTIHVPGYGRESKLFGIEFEQ